LAAEKAKKAKKDVTESWRVKASPADPITKREDIRRLREHFVKHYLHGQLYALIFTLGCNLGLRAGDLLNLTVSDVYGKSHLEIFEKKTGKARRIFINGRVRGALDKHISQFLYITPQARLFGGQKGYVLTVKSLHRIIRAGCKAIGLTGNYGSHTMRKTFAYFAHEYTHDVRAVRRLLMHSSLAVTHAYVEPGEDERSYSRSDDEVYSGLNL